MASLFVSTMLALCPLDSSSTQRPSCLHGSVYNDTAQNEQLLIIILRLQAGTRTGKHTVTYSHPAYIPFLAHWSESLLQEPCLPGRSSLHCAWRHPNHPNSCGQRHQGAIHSQTIFMSNVTYPCQVSKSMFSLKQSSSQMELLGDEWGKVLTIKALSSSW